MAKQRKSAAAPTIADQLVAVAAPAAPAAQSTVLYVVGKGFKPRTNNGYGGKGRNPQESAWSAVCAALPADQSTLVAIVRQVATHNGALIANGPGYPASFVAKRIRTGALVAKS
jgi:hypothetical protein